MLRFLLKFHRTNCWKWLMTFWGKVLYLCEHEILFRMYKWSGVTLSAVNGNESYACWSLLRVIGASSDCMLGKEQVLILVLRSQSNWAMKSLNKSNYHKAQHQFRFLQISIAHCPFHSTKLLNDLLLSHKESRRKTKLQMYTAQVKTRGIIKINNIINTKMYNKL